MTLDTTENRVEFTGNDVTTAFSFPNRFLADGDLVVILRTILTGVGVVQTITTHYTVSGAGAAAGGTVTMITAPASTEELIIYRAPAYTQGLDLVPNGPQPAESVEEAHDRAMMVAQRNEDLIGRSIQLKDEFAGTFDNTLPVLLPADSFLAVNSAGDGWVTIDAITTLMFTVGAGSGMLSRSGTALTPRTITPTANETTVADGDGVSGNPIVGLADNLLMPGTEGYIPPTGTTAQRDGSASAGETRLNSSVSKLEVFENSQWRQMLTDMNRPGFINLTVRPATTTDTDDSIIITGIDGASLSDGNPGFVLMPNEASGSGGLIEIFRITANVTILLTGATFGVGAAGDIDSSDGQQLNVYALNDGSGTLKWGVAYNANRRSFLGTLDSATPGDINIFNEILVNVVLAGDSAAMQLSWFLADFDIAGSPNNLWTVRDDLDEMNLCSVIRAPWEANVWSRGSADASDPTGSTSTATRFLTETLYHLGEAITLTSDAAGGTIFTVNKNGMYSMSYSDSFSAAVAFGISLNASGNVSILSIPTRDRLAIANTHAATVASSCSAVALLKPNDVVRPHTIINPSNGTVALSIFTIALMEPTEFDGVGFP